MGTQAHLEQLSWSVPYLSPRTFVVHLECFVTFRNFLLEFGRIPDGAEVDRIRRSENGGLLRKVAVMWVVQRVLDEVPHEHLYLSGWRFVPLEVIRGNEFVIGMVNV